MKLERILEKMKRFAFFFTLILIVGMALSSCIKGDMPSGTKNENALSGTKWLGAEGGSTMELRFTKTDFELKEVNVNEAITGSYVYEAPNVTFIATSFKDASGKTQQGGGSFTGVVNSKVMTIDMNGSKARFIKQ